MSGRTARPASARPGNRKLIGAGVAGLAGVFALAPLANAAPTPNPTPGSHAPVKAKVAVPSAAETTSSAPAVEAQFGFKKIRVGVQQKDGSYVPPTSTTVGTKITISQVGGPFVGDTPFVEDCVTAADSRIDSDAASASFCDFADDGGDDDVTSRVRSKLSARQLRAITKPVDEDNTPGSQSYLVAPGATVTITQTSVNPGYVIDPASPLTVEPCQEPVPDERGRAAAVVPPTCDSEQYILEDGGMPPVAGDDSATTTEDTAVGIAIAPNDTPQAPIETVAIKADPKHGTARLIAAETDDPTPSPSGSSGPSGSTGPTGPTDEPSPTETITLERKSARAAAGVRSLAAVSSYRAVYTPAPGFTGVDTFDYTITTANGTATATVTVTVTGAAASASETAGTGVSGAAESDDPLADTGTQSGDLLGYAAALLAAGGGALAIGRQRRRGRHAR